MIYLYLITILLILFLAYSWCYNYRLKDTHYEISDSQVPECMHGKCIALLADLHGNELGKQNKKILNIINEYKPDYVAMAGDMVSSKPASNKKVHLLCEQLTHKYPVYFSMGNHEEEIGLEDTLRCMLCSNTKFLYNDSVDLLGCEGKVRIGGLAISEQFYGRLWNRKLMTKEDIQMQLGNKSSEYTILLAHNPEHAQGYADWGADLVLSGHMHGGVAKLPVVGGVIAPSLMLFPKYDYGVKKIGDTTVVISGGMGLHGIKFRFFNMPEVVFIHFR